MTVFKTDTFIYDVVFDGVKSIIKGISVSLFFIFFMNKKKTGWKNSAVQTETRNMSFMTVVSPQLLFLSLMSGLSVAG